MKCLNIIYEEADDLVRVRDDLKGYPFENILIQVFCGIPDIEFVNCLRSLISTLFPGSAMIGASSAGEVINAAVVEESIVLSFTAFEHTRVKSALVTQNDDLKAGGKSMGNALKDSDVMAVIVLGCGLKDGNYVNNRSFLKALNQKLGGVIIAGGQSGGYNELESRVFVFTEKDLTEQGFAGAALYSSHLCINTAYNLSWTPIGKKMTVTHAKGRRIYRIDNQSVKDIYMKYLGIKAASSTLYLMNHFPLMIEREGMTLTNPVSSVNSDGSFNVLEKFHVGEQVRFSYCDAGLQEVGARRLGQKIAQYVPEAVFVYSCESRKTLFEDDIVMDMTFLEKCPNAAGFFTFGECYTGLNQDPRFLQQTMTILALSETETCRVFEEEEAFVEPADPLKTNLRRFRLLKVLSHLVASTTRELEQKNRELARVANKDGLTGLFNRRFFDETLENRMKEHSRSGAPLSLILMDVDFFKQFNDHYGHVAGDDCLKKIARALQKEMKRTSDMAFRYGGEEFICILPSTPYSGAVHKAEAIRVHVEGLAIPHEKSLISPFATLSLGVITLADNRHITPEELMDGCDQLMYEAKHGGRNRLHGKNLS